MATEEAPKIEMHEMEVVTCDVCGGDHDTEFCPEITTENLDDSVKKTLSKARLSLPSNLDLVEQLDGCIRIVSKEKVAAKTRFGPLEARRTTQNIDVPNGFMLKVFGQRNACTVSLDTSDEDECNWLCLVQTARTQAEQNCMAFQIGTDLFYNTTREIQPGEELRVWYAPHYAKKMGMSTLPDANVKVLVSLNVTTYEVPVQTIKFQEDGEETTVVFLPEGMVLPDETEAQLPVVLHERSEHPVAPQFIPTPGTAASMADSLGTPFGTPSRMTPVKTSTPGTPTQANFIRGTTTKLSLSPEGSLPATPDKKEPAILYRKAIQEGESFKCRRCECCFPTSMELAKHVQAHLKSYQCKLCKQRFFKKFSLNRHFKLFHRLSHETEIGQQIIHSPLEERPENSDSEPTPSSSHMDLDGAKTTYIDLIKTSPKKRRSTKDSDDSDYVPSSERQSQRHHKYHTRGKRTNFKALAGYKERKEPASRDEDDESESEKGDTEILIQGEVGMMAEAENDVIQTLMSAAEIGSGSVDENADVIPGDGEVAASRPTAGEVTPSGDGASQESVTGTGVDELQKAVESMDTDDAPSQIQPSKGVAVLLDDDAEKKERLLTKGKLEDLIFKQKFEDGRYALYETVSGIQAYKCGFCEVCCTKMDSIKKHMEKHAEKKFCEDCGRFFDTQLQVDHHLCRSRIKNLEPNADGTFPCPDCGKLFKTRENLEPHFMGHAQNFNCPKCCKFFMRKDTLENHSCIADEGAKKKVHICDICGATFKSMKYLFRHMTGHTKELTCLNCNKSFSRKQSLLQHLNKCNRSQLKDMDVEIHACSKCPKVFSDHVKLQNHMVWHEGKFRCKECGKSFSTQMTLTGHVCSGKMESDGGEGSDHDGAEKQLFECQVCEKVFFKELTLERHMVSHSDKFQCTMCRKNFGRKLDLEMHEIVCSGRISIQEKGFVKCTVCDTEFFNVNEFFKHSLEHSTPYKCGRCQRPYRSMHGLEEHTKTCTGEWSDTTCPICGKVFRDVRYLERHKILHTRPKFQCEHCHKWFHRKDYFGYHTCKRADGTIVRVNHKHPKGATQQPTEEVSLSHLCPTCGKSYVSVGNLNKHMKRHGEKMHMCPTCGRRFHLKASLKEHMRYVHTKKLSFQCPHCGKMLKSRNTVHAHIKQFHQENVMIYTCETCGKTFRQKGNLLKHQLMHTEGKSFQCPYCERQFKYPEQLGKHKVEHEQGRKFACTECDKAFVKEYDLRHHIEVFHSGLMYTCEFCSTDCRHTHTMRRHIRRRHPEKVALLDEPNYIKSLQRTLVNPDGTLQQITRQHVSKSTKPLNVVQHVNVEDVSGIIESVTQTEEAVHSLQQIQSINIGGTELQVIEETPDNQDVATIIDNVMSHEAAEVLQSLASTTQDGNVTVATFTDIPNFAMDGTATHVIHHDAETQEYILVPLIQAETGVQVKTEEVQVIAQAE